MLRLAHAAHVFVSRDTFCAQRMCVGTSIDVATSVCGTKERQRRRSTGVLLLGQTLLRSHTESHREGGCNGLISWMEHGGGKQHDRLGQ